MSRRRLGISLMPLETRRDVIVSLAASADAHGYDAFYQNETWALDATLLLAEAALRTRRISLGTGILGVWSRSPGLLAMAASTLASISAGRFVLGLGASTPQLTEGLHDMPYAAPVERMRRTVLQVRALLRGDRIPLSTATQARPLKLNALPASDLPIYLAALSDASVRLAGEVGDGWLPFLYPRDRLADGIALLREGAEGSGEARRLEVHPTVPTVVAEDTARAREGAAWFVAFYLSTMGPHYRRSLVRQGYGRQVDAVLAANTPRMRGLVPPEAEELLEQLTIYGTPAEARERLQRWYDVGSDMPLVFLRPNLPPEELRYTIDAFRPALEAASAARE